MATNLIKEDDPTCDGLPQELAQHRARMDPRLRGDDKTRSDDGREETLEAPRVYAQRTRPAS